MSVNAIDRMIEAFGSIDIESLTLDSVMAHEDEIVAENVMQMRRGLMPDGTEISPYYTMEGYAWMKRNDPNYSRFDLADRREDVPNLGVTGAFYEGIHFERSESEILITSSDRKWESAPSQYNRESLHERYGEVLGIPTQYQDGELRETVSEDLTNYIREILDQ